MRKLIWIAALLAGCLIGTVGWTADPYDFPSRSEIRRVDLSGAPGMEVITSILEIKKGETIPAHLHHGIEAAYVLQGSLVKYPGRPPTLLKTGTPLLNLRDVVHGGFTVVGDRPLRIFTVHIVDKGKPLFQWSR